MKIISICLLLEGVLWALSVVWLFLAIWSITDPISYKLVGIYFLAEISGPAILVVGSSLVLCQQSVKVGAVLSLVGCIFLSVIVGCEFFQSFGNKPLQINPPRVMFGAIFFISLLFDVGAIWLSRKAIMAKSR